MKHFQLPILILFSFTHILLSCLSPVMAQEALPVEGQIAYVNLDNNIWIVDAGSKQNYQVTSDANESISYLSPRYSPDGAMLAYCQKISGEKIQFKLYISRVGEWQPILITENIRCKYWPNRNFDWSPDGTKILYNHYSETQTGEGENLKTETNQGLWMIDIASGSSSEVIPQPDANPLLNPQWSPDGRWIKFYQASYFTGLGSLMTGENESGTIYSWLNAGRIWPGYSDWAPDSTHVIFDEVPYTGFPGAGLYMATPNGERINQIFSKDGYIVTKPLWSPALSKIAFQLKSFRDNSSSLAFVAPDGSNFQEVYSSPSFLMPSTWSPNGDQILFGVGIDSGYELIYHDLASGSNVSIGTAKSAGADWSYAALDDAVAQEPVIYPGFSYSDSLLLYVSPENQLILYDPEDNSQLELTDALAVTNFYPSPTGRHYIYGRHFSSLDFQDTGDLVKQESLIPSSPSSEGVSWSPSEERISYRDWKGDYWIADIDGNAQKIPSATSLPLWSADNSMISYCVEDDTLMILGGTSQSIKVDDNTDCTPLWSPTRNLLVYNRILPGSPSQTVVYNIDTGVSTTIFENSQVIGWAPDGRFLALKSKLQEIEGDAYTIFISDPGGNNLLEVGQFSASDIGIMEWTLSDSGHYLGAYFIAPDLSYTTPIADGLIDASRNGNRLLVAFNEMDKKVIACEDTTTGDQSRLLTVDLSNINENNLPGIWGWMSPDGSSIISRSFINPEFTNLLMKCDTPGQINLPFGGFPSIAEYSEDGNWFLVGISQNGNSNQVVLLNLAQGGIERISTNQGSPITWLRPMDMSGIHTVTGSVVTEDKNPLPSASVFVNGILVTTTNESGQFTIARLMPGKHELTVQKPGFVFSPSTYKINVPPDVDDVVFEARKGKLRPTEEPPPTQEPSDSGQTPGDSDPQPGLEDSPLGFITPYLDMVSEFVGGVYQDNILPMLEDVGSYIPAESNLLIYALILAVVVLFVIFIFAITFTLLRKRLKSKLSAPSTITPAASAVQEVDDTQPIQLKPTPTQGATQQEQAAMQTPAQVQQEAVSSTTEHQISEWMETGMNYVKNGDYENGHRLLRQVVQAKPEEANAWLWLGYIATQKKDFRAAERCFRAAKNYNDPKADRALEWLSQQQDTG